MRVPAVSKKSTKRKVNTTLTTPKASAAPRSMARNRSVGAVITTAVTATIPIMMAPLIFCARSAPVITIPPNATQGSQELKSPTWTKVAGESCKKPAPMNPMIARNAPIPAVMACFRCSGIAFRIHSRKPVRAMIAKRIPEMKTAPNAVCHGCPGLGQP